MSIALLVLASIRYGAGPERALALVLLAMSLSSKAYLALVGRGPIRTGPDPGLLLIEMFVTAAMVAIALRANRVYPLWMAGFAMIALFGFVAKELATQISPLAQAIMTVGPSYFQIIILACGIWLHHRRTRRHGSYRSWRSSSPPSPARMPHGSPRR